MRASNLAIRILLTTIGVVIAAASVPTMAAEEETAEEKAAEASLAKPVATHMP